MSSLSLDLKRLHEWALQVRVPITDGDLGYAVHSASRAAFGELGPQPFAVRGVEHGRPLVYGYGTADGEALRAQLAAFADPRLAAVFPDDGILTKPMPLTTFVAGRRLGFSVRTCPVLRQDAGSRDRSHETDAFLVAALASPAQPVDREAVYRAWLGSQLERGGAARLVASSLIAFRRVTVSRRDAGRRARHGEKPDALIDGTLEVADTQAFGRLLARGIGRHRAFGFGMLLLRPPNPNL